MKAASGSIVRLTVLSKLPEFKNIQVKQKLVDKSATWDSFLLNNGVELNPDIHCLSALNGRSISLPQNKISDIIDSFRRKVSVYTVYIIKSSSPVLRARLRQQENKREQNFDEVRQSNRKRKPNRRYSNSEAEGDAESHAEVPSSSVIDLEYLYRQPRAVPPSTDYNEDAARRFNDYPFDSIDAISVASKDTFDNDIGEDIKGVIMEKLRHWATNGDLHRIREELRMLQENRKSLKVARYIPYTMNVLGVLFGNT